MDSRALSRPSAVAAATRTTEWKYPWEFTTASAKALTASASTGTEPRAVAASRATSAFTSPSLAIRPRTPVRSRRTSATAAAGAAETAAGATGAAAGAAATAGTDLGTTAVDRFAVVLILRSLGPSDDFDESLFDFDAIAGSSLKDKNFKSDIIGH